MDCPFYTINAFFRYDEKIVVILVLPEDDIATWHVLCKKHNFTKPLILQKGGDTRFQSVKTDLKKLKAMPACRTGRIGRYPRWRSPLVSEDIIGASFRLAAVHQLQLRLSD